jgi:hypothetical protein
MFTIDLLKGKGIPIKSGPEGIAIAAGTLAVPIIIATVMFGYYLHTKVDISINKQRIASYETKIEGLSEGVELQRAFEREKGMIGNCLTEVSSSIDGHIQWSPILATVVKNMPDSVVLTGLEVKERSVKRKIPKADDPKIMIDVTVPARILQMNVSARPESDSDKEVKDFRERLLVSALLGPKLEDIRVSQEFDMLEGKDVVSYEIDCLFKPEL